MHDVQPRLHSVLFRTHLGEGEVIAALQLDPLAVLRGLRAAHAPVFRESPALPSVQVMVKRLGLANSRRLLACPPVTVATDSPLRQLWLHSIATATAAADLSSQSGLMDPNAAYLIGLVGDLAQWLVALREAFPQPGVAPSSGECAAQWQLPATLATHVRATRTLDADDTMVWMPTDVTGLLQAARRLANLAGFAAPRLPHEPEAPRVAAADKSELDAIERLQRRVAVALGAFGLGEEVPAVATRGECPVPALLAGERAGVLIEAVLGILGCSRSETYRGIVTALTSAALRYGDYDRAFYAKWLPKTGILTLRSKADSSSRRIQQWRYQVTPSEMLALQRALTEDCPVRLEAALRPTTGLLAGLSTDELLAVPLNGTLQQPSFLLLDRSLTVRPLDLGDRAIALTLGRTGSLLNENLLLRRRRQRAQKFSLTDPLTRLFNRRMGLLALEQEIARSERSARPVTVLMCDLDHFKQLNDALGHLQGDHALRATADVLRQTLRKGDTICRHGGEEFLVVLPDTSPADASVLAARLFTAVQSRGEELGLPITISVGLTAYRPGDTVEAILQRADHALYASKGYGRNRFSVDLEPGEEPITVHH